MMLAQHGFLGGLRAAKDLFWELGNSICEGTSGGGVGIVQPTAGTAEEYAFAEDDVRAFGTGSLSQNANSPWAAFARLYHTNTSRITVHCNAGVGSSTLSASTGNNDWSITGTCWPRALAALDRTRALRPGVTLKAVMIGEILINDVQGLSGTSGLTVAQIKTNLYDFIDRVIAKVGPGVPIVFNLPGRTSSILMSAKLSGCRNSVRSAAIDYADVYIGMTMGGFTVGGFWQGDLIHPSGNGNSQLGRQCARWFQNAAVPKWPRFICSMLEQTGVEGLIPSADITQISNWLSDAATLASYLKLEYFYGSMGRYQFGPTYNTLLDWSGMCSPNINGNFTVGGTTPNQYVTCNAAAFYDGFTPNVSCIYASLSDAQFGFRITRNGTAAGVAATAFGAGNVFMDQTSGSVTRFNVFTTASDVGPDTKVQPARYVLRRTGGNILLVKNGTAVAGGARVNSTLGASAQTLGALAGGNPKIDADYTELWCIQDSAVPVLADWLTSLDSLFA